MNNSRQGANIFFNQNAQKSYDESHVQSADAQSNNKGGSQLRPSSQKRKQKITKPTIKRGRGSSAGSNNGKNGRTMKPMLKEGVKYLNINPNIEIPVKDIKKQPMTVTNQVNGITVGGSDIFNPSIQHKISPKQASTPYAAGRKLDESSGNYGSGHEGQHGTFALTKINEKFTK